MRWRYRSDAASVGTAVHEAEFELAAIRAGYTLDAAQRRAVAALATTPDHGFYLWGSVGRGKTWILNTYVDAVPTPRKKRVHFHEFFLELHAAIRRHGSSIERALDELLQDIDVLCFDEFHVHDVGDAAFIRRMLLTLLDRPVRLVVTSNYRPDGLLPNPLFHKHFVSTIELIKSSLTIIELDGTHDFRADSAHQSGFSSGRWIAADIPADLVRPQHFETAVLRPAGHPVTALRADNCMLWLSFTDLCDAPTAAADYLALAQRWSHWVLSDVPPFEAMSPSAAQRFANTIDVLYDRDVRLDVLASVSLAHLAGSARAPADAGRILSRLGQLRQM